VAQKLISAGIRATAFHGDLSQGARTRVISDLKQSLIKVVVATDLAARGLDIKSLPVVVNYDLPRSTDDYLHRIGRTGRAGEKGMAVSFVTAMTHPHFALIEKRHNIQVPREQVPGFEPVDLAPPPRDPNGGIKGLRPSKKDKLRAEAARRARMGGGD
jgi:superfamily II DNA/RNA helicase